MRVVVSGGTGFIGRAVGHALLSRGANVVALTRGPRRWIDHACAECAPLHSKLELVTWTPEQPGEWQDTVDGADVVIHLAGASVRDGRWTTERKEEIRASRVESTRLLAEAIARARTKPKVFVSGSAYGYYGRDTDDRVLDEGSPRGDDFFGRICAEWEAAADPAREAGVRVVHPRLGLVLGRGGGLMRAMVPMFRAFVGGPVGNGNQWVPWVHQRDVVHAFEAFIDRDDLAGAFNLTAPEPVTMRTFAETLAGVLGRPQLLRVPSFALKLAMGQMSDILVTGPRVVPKRLVDAGYAFMFPELASALADLV